MLHWLRHIPASSHKSLAEDLVALLILKSMQRKAGSIVSIMNPVLYFTIPAPWSHSQECYLYTLMWSVLACFTTSLDVCEYVQSTIWDLSQTTELWGSNFLITGTSPCRKQRAGYREVWPVTKDVVVLRWSVVQTTVLMWKFHPLGNTEPQCISYSFSTCFVSGDGHHHPSVICFYQSADAITQSHVCFNNSTLDWSTGQWATASKAGVTQPARAICHWSTCW